MTDYISREAAIDDISSRLNLTDLEGNPVNAKDIRAYVAELINHVPAADVRPVVRGKWYWDKDGMDWNIGAWRCSACKAMSPMWWNADRGSPMHKSGHKFCPNCGCAMEGTE